MIEVNQGREAEAKQKDDHRGRSTVLKSYLISRKKNALKLSIETMGAKYSDYLYTFGEKIEDPQRSSMV